MTLVDRDPGPRADGSWKRAGVMQFEHAHGWRPQVVDALRAEMPDVYDALHDAGALLMHPPGLPQMEAMACRRPVVERVLRACAARQPGLTWVTGHVDDILVENGVATGLVVDAAPSRSDIVVVATGRASRLGERLRGPVEGGPCGFSYVTRVYRARDGHVGYDRFFPSFETGPGYVSLVMGHDAGTHSVVIAYPTDAAELAMLRTNAGQDRACRVIPHLVPWTDPERFEPLTDALVGGHLTNTYRLQGPALGLPPARGLYFLGDAVMTTNPAAGRNLALLLGHARHFLASVDDPEQDLDDASLALDAWSEQHLRGWYLDHVHWDRTLLRRFAGDDIDLEDRIPSDVICAAAEDRREPQALCRDVLRHGGRAGDPRPRRGPGARAAARRVAAHGPGSHGGRARRGGGLDPGPVPRGEGSGRHVAPSLAHH